MFQLAVNIAMLCVHSDPIKPASCNCSRMVASWQHLPCAKGQAGAGLQGLLQSIGRLHYVSGAFIVSEVELSIIYITEVRRDLYTTREEIMLRGPLSFNLA